MAGIESRLTYDPCYIRYQEDLDIGVYDYNIYRPKFQRPHVGKCTESLGVICSTYGGMDRKKVLQDSFLSGRGQVYTDCPEGDVITLPQGVFETHGSRSRSRCESTELTPETTRKPRSCNGLSEIDASTWAFMPGSFQPHYMGVNALGNRFYVNSRELSRQALIAQKQMAISATHAGSGGVGHKSGPMAYNGGKASKMGMEPFGHVGGMTGGGSGRMVVNTLGGYQPMLQYGREGQLPLYA